MLITIIMMMMMMLLNRMAHCLTGSADGLAVGWWCASETGKEME